MCLQNVINLQVSPLEACVKIDDTVPGIEEGLSASMWTIGLAISGNEVGLPLAEWRALASAEQASRRSRAYERLRMAGAHYVVDTIADVLPCFDDIAARLARRAALADRRGAMTNMIDTADVVVIGGGVD